MASKKSNSGRKPIPKGKKKGQIAVYIEQERIDKAGGIEAARVKLSTLAQKAF